MIQFALLNIKSILKRKNFVFILLVLVLQVSLSCFNENYITALSSKSTYLGDSYANKVVRSLSATDTSEALGAPDGSFAKIYESYENGYVVLDMGYYEEITNKVGDDFRVIAKEGGYRVRLSNNLSTFPIDIGTGLGNQSFDFNSTGYESVRYVIIEYKNGSYVELDALEAYYITEVETENNTPDIENIDDFWIWDNQSQIEMNWNVYDEYPWNYSIYANDSFIESEEWDGVNVNFLYEVQSPGIVNISLVIYDLFGNFNVDIVIIEIREVISLTPSKSEFSFTMIFFTYLFFSICLKLKKKRKKSVNLN